MNEVVGKLQVGAVAFEEKLKQAIKGELKEEFGVEIAILKQYPAKDHLLPAENQHWVATCFEVRLKPGQIPQILETRQI